MDKIKPYMFVHDRVSWYYYLIIEGGTGKKDLKGGQYGFYLTYLRPEQRDERSGEALDYWCKERQIPCGVGDTIEEAHNDFQHQLIRLPLK